LKWGAVKEKWKIDRLRELESAGVVRENCPEPDYWRFNVLKPEDLPEQFRAEYEQWGELRWA
jgi:hypothetical protein